MQASWNFQGRVAIVTGGTAGIGLAITEQLIASGARVAVAARDGNDLQALEERFGDALLGVQTDVTVAAEVDRLIDRTCAHFGRIDMAFNNAGGARLGHVASMDDALWDDVINLSLRSVFLCVRRQSARMIAQGGGGAIVNLSSVSGLVPQPNSSAYSTAKAGVAMLTRAAAQELAPYGIRVNALAPGLVETRATGGLAKSPLISKFTERMPMGRLGQPDEIAHPALFLASDAASYITGSVLLVDGGWTQDNFPNMSAYGMGPKPPQLGE